MISPISIQMHEEYDTIPLHNLFWLPSYGMDSNIEANVDRISWRFGTD